jgi:hypothetical protein
LIRKGGSRELQNKVAELSREDNEIEMLLRNELDKLSDLQSVYLSATLPQKQELIRKGSITVYTIKMGFIEPLKR